MGPSHVRRQKSGVEVVLIGDVAAVRSEWAASLSLRMGVRLCRWRGVSNQRVSSSDRSKL